MAIGSGAWRDPKDPAGVIWTITGRGPNLECKDIVNRIGLDTQKLCAGNQDGRSFPAPDFAIKLLKLEIGADNKARILETIVLKGKSGKPISGLPVASSTVEMEKGYDGTGALIASDPSGLDTETVARLLDGSFIIGDEYGPSFVEAAPDGTMIRRHVPVGVESLFSGADYAVVGSLPAIMAKRVENRGIECIAVSPDGTMIYIAMQSPLANPDRRTHRDSPMTRLWKIERASGKVLEEYVYILDDPKTFESDSRSERRNQNTVGLSEMVFLSNDKLLVVERLSKTAKFYTVNLADGTPVLEAFDDPATTPSLEQLTADQLMAIGLRPLKKTLLLDSDMVPDMPPRIEGVAVMSPTEMIVISDSNFGVSGDPTYMRRVTFPAPVLQ